MHDPNTSCGETPGGIQKHHKLCFANPSKVEGVKTKLSRDAHDRLKAEFDDMYYRGRVDIARKIEAAREMGDLSENGDYHAAKEEQGRMDGRMKQIMAILDNAEVVDEIDTSNVSSGLGC